MDNRQKAGSQPAKVEAGYWGLSGYPLNRDSIFDFTLAFFQYKPGYVGSIQLCCKAVSCEVSNASFGSTVSNFNALSIRAIDVYTSIPVGILPNTALP